MRPEETERGISRVGFMVVVFLVAALAALGGAALLVNITERKQEGRNPFFRVVELTDETEDPEIWGKNFPMQYDGYKHTTDQVRTRFGGSEAVPKTPSQVDPRSVVAQSRLEEDPRLKEVAATLTGVDTDDLTPRAAWELVARLRKKLTDPPSSGS